MPWQPRSKPGEAAAWAWSRSCLSCRADSPCRQDTGAHQDLRIFALL